MSTIDSLPWELLDIILSPEMLHTRYPASQVCTQWHKLIVKPESICFPQETSLVDYLPYGWKLYSWAQARGFPGIQLLQSNHVYLDQPVMDAMAKYSLKDIHRLLREAIIHEDLATVRMCWSNPLCSQFENYEESGYQALRHYRKEPAFWNYHQSISRNLVEFKQIIAYTCDQIAQTGDVSLLQDLIGDFPEMENYYWRMAKIAAAHGHLSSLEPYIAEKLGDFVRLKLLYYAAAGGQYKTVKLYYEEQWLTRENEIKYTSVARLLDFASGNIFGNFCELRPKWSPERKALIEWLQSKSSGQFIPQIGAQQDQELIRYLLSYPTVAIAFDKIYWHVYELDLLQILEAKRPPWVKVRSHINLCNISRNGSDKTLYFILSSFNSINSSEIGQILDASDSIFQYSWNRMMEGKLKEQWKDSRSLYYNIIMPLLKQEKITKLNWLRSQGVIRSSLEVHKDILSPRMLAWCQKHKIRVHFIH
jgi:hypothetical protein